MALTFRQYERKLQRMSSLRCGSHASYTISINHSTCAVLDVLMWSALRCILLLRIYQAKWCLAFHYKLLQLTEPKKCWFSHWPIAIYWLIKCSLSFASPHTSPLELGLDKWPKWLGLYLLHEKSNQAETLLCALCRWSSLKKKTTIDKQIAENEK